MSVKLERIETEIRNELSRIMLLEAKDNVLKQVTLTGARVSSDLSYADIYYTYMGSLSEDEVARELKGSAGYLRTKLANAIDLRHTPELRFIYDKSIEYGANIERIINEIHKND